jgi:hypothetical protein
MIITTPRACLGAPRWVRVGARTVGFDPTQLGPGTTHIKAAADVWGPVGTKLSELLPPFGPPVWMG